MRCVCLIVFLSGGLALAQPAPKGGARELPPDAKKAVAEANAEVRKIRVRLVESLQKVLEAETKKGNLDSALVIRAEIDRLKKADPSVMGGLTEEKGLEEAKKLLVGGKWKLSIVGNVYTAEWEFQEDGSVVMVDGNGKTDAKWTVEVRGKTQMITIDLGPVHTMQFPFPQAGKRLQGIKPGSKERIELSRQ